MLSSKQLGAHLNGENLFRLTGGRMGYSAIPLSCFFAREGEVAEIGGFIGGAFSPKDE